MTSLRDLGGGAWAYFQGGGAWGESNAGLVVDSGESLLIDTLFDVPRTDAMLREMRDAARIGRPGTVLNTHANGDHWYGNSAVAGARIVATRATADEMREIPPKKMAALVGAATALSRVGERRRAIARLLRRVRLKTASSFIEAAPFVTDIFGPFRFRGIEVHFPTETFDGELTIRVGGTEVKLIEVGPAHTRGDTVAWIPSRRLLFTGDILFNGGHPIAWEGPLSNWTRALERLLELKPDVVIPGHGPIADTRAIEKLRDYFVWLEREARTRFDAGLTVVEAANDISLDAYADWTEHERIYVNVDTAYRSFAHSKRTDPITLFAGMARVCG
jgi:glyoxylase-like metal-dependent hydrolase (beta-lactamase superfamily II)